MKRTRFFQIFSLVSCFLLAASAVFAQPGEGRGGNFADFSYSLSPTRTVELGVVKQLIGTSEFAEFFDAFTAKIDEEYVKASNQPNFPAPIADPILDKVREAKGKTEISSKDVIELFFSEVELIQFEAYLKRAYDAGATEKNNPELGKYVRLTFVTKFSPAELAAVLDILKVFIAVDMIKAEENDFLVSFCDPNNSEIKLFIGGRNIEELGNYVTVFSFSRELVEQRLNMMQNERGRRFMLGENTPAESLRLGGGVFDVAKAELQKKIDAGENKEKDMLRIVEQINNFSLVTRDFEGKTGTRARLALNSEQVASDLKDMAEGGKAMLRFIAGSESVDANARALLDLLLNTEIERDGQNLVATINWSNDDLAQLAKDVFKKMTADIKK